MKTTTIICLLMLSLSVNAQLENKQFNKEKNNTFFNNEHEIIASNTSVSIITKAIYNAIPDGYHVTYTSSFISNSVEEVENQMNKRMDDLIKKLSVLKMTKQDVLVDVISLDPLFDFKQGDSALPTGYKIVENITFNVKNISLIRELSKICLDFGIYDMIDAQAYLNNSKVIYDSLSQKTVEILNMKKKLCADIGWTFVDGNVTMSKFKDVFYPNERYLTSYIKNATLYKHHLSQSSTINVDRIVDVDDYFNLNLKDADFVFNANSVNPVIQFYFELRYTFTKKDTEAEMREKIRKEEEKKPTKEFYIIDKAGGLKKVDM